MSLLFLIFISGCKGIFIRKYGHEKRVISLTNSRQEQKLEAFMRDKQDGVITIFHREAFNVNELGYCDLVAQFYNIDTLKYLPIVMVDAFSLNPTNHFAFYEETPSGSLFGKHVEIKLEKLVTDSIYIPQQLKVNFKDGSIKEGALFTWNPDPLNQKGIFISAFMAANAQDTTLGITDNVSVNLWTVGLTNSLPN